MQWCGLPPVVVVLLVLDAAPRCAGLHSYFKRDMGTLSGDVQNWAQLIQNYILELPVTSELLRAQLASEGIKREFTQSLFDSANYTYERKNGEELVQQVKLGLGQYFSKKKLAAQRLADKVIELYDSLVALNQSETRGVERLSDLNRHVYRDSDIPSRFPDDLRFSPYFKQSVSSNCSAVKISDEVPRDDPVTIETVAWTAQLESVFKQNARDDPQLRWQYFGSTAGLVRMYPGREWDTNFAGFYNDYDPRVRPWYIASTSGPKDVVIILDCSLSMRDKDKFRIAQAVARTVVNTLTRQDYINIICARASHWNEVGKWHYYTTEVLSCQHDRLVQATLSHRKDLIEKVDKLEPGGTSEFEHGFDVAFDLLAGKMRTGCQAIIIFVTDGKDTDGEHVRCGPGYYTRSGYVPGPICKYNWTKVWDVVDARNGRPSSRRTPVRERGDVTVDGWTEGRGASETERSDGVKQGPSDDTKSHAHTRLSNRIRVFSYLTVDEGELLPGRLACDHRGSLRRLRHGENLISQMSNYFELLSGSAAALGSSGGAVGGSRGALQGSIGLWTSPYLDAWGLGLLVTRAIPCISRIDGKTIGVVGVDATLEEIENFLNRHQWGTVYSFLMNRDGETIFHPRLKPSETLVNDPIFIPIEQLEMNKDGQPVEFLSVMREMKDGRTGSITVPRARKAKGKNEYIPATYYYAALDDSEYSFAFSLSETDQVFRRAQEPEDKSLYEKSYFNLLIEYNSAAGRSRLPGTFEYLQVKENERRFPGLRVSYLHSSIFLAPKCHCDPNAYFFNDDLAQKTVDAHLYINGVDEDLGCDLGGAYIKGLRADVLISQPVEKLWRTRDFEGIKDVKWTYVGMRSGVFRTYPAHRSRRNYDPTSRAWYKVAESAPSRTSISTAYMDAAGVGKIITISQALCEGMTQRSTEECRDISSKGPWPGGCFCTTDDDCIIGQCYVSSAPGPNRDTPRCGTERVEAVTSLDVLYNRFHEISMATMEASDGRKSCGQLYPCPDGEPDCQTRCYLFDRSANLITDPDFIAANDLDESKYKGVTMGRKEGEVMKDLIYTHRFFQRIESIDFQDVCSITPYAPKVTLHGIPKNPEEQDDYYKNKGPIPKFSNEYGCITDVVRYVANESALGISGMVVGNVSGPCMSGFYYVTALPKTNLFLLVIENWKQYKDTFFYNFNCRIAQSIVNSGSYRIINGTCAHTDSSSATLAEKGQCPVLRDIDIPCDYNAASLPFVPASLRACLCLYSAALFLHAHPLQQ